MSSVLEFDKSILERFTVKFYSKKNLHQQGSAIVLALFALTGVGVLTMVIIQAKKNAIRIATKNTADKDVENAVARIGSLLLAPDSCKANFAGLPQTGSLASIKNGDSSTAIVLNNWAMYGGTVTTKAQLNTASYAITTAQAVGATSFKPALLTLTLRFTKNLGVNSNAPGVAAIVTSVVNFRVNAFVVTNIYNNVTRTLNPNTTILGCAKNPASTISY